MIIYVCTTCGSADIQQDAWSHMNLPGEIQTFPDKFCENCQGQCTTKEVEVSDDFDIYNDLYKEST